MLYRIILTISIFACVGLAQEKPKSDEKDSLKETISQLDSISDANRQQAAKLDSIFKK